MNEPAATLALRDIHLPQAVSWWPPAPGWWLLAGALIVLGILLWLGVRRWQKKQRHRDSMRAFRAIRAQFEQQQDATTLLRELSVLMRRASISFYPRQTTASLTGDAWLQFLDDTSRTKNSADGFKHGCGKWLASAPYLPDNARPDIDSNALLKLCEHWLNAQPNKRAAVTGSKTS